MVNKFFSFLNSIIDKKLSCDIYLYHNNNLVFCLCGVYSIALSDMSENIKFYNTDNVLIGLLNIGSYTKILSFECDIDTDFFDDAVKLYLGS